MTADSGNSLESRLRRVEDLLEIHQLFVDYGRHLDRGDFAAFAQLFARDGEIRLGTLARAKGREEIQAAMEAMLTGRVGDTLHVISSPAVELAGDTATSEVMWTVLARSADGGLIVTSVGRHVDELVREDGRWRIQQRKGLVDLAGAGPLL